MPPVDNQWLKDWKGYRPDYTHFCSGVGKRLVMLIVESRIRETALKTHYNHIEIWSLGKERLPRSIGVIGDLWAGAIDAH